MKIEEFGKENQDIIIMLHGANFVHTFGSQYILAKEYHIIVPHLMGFGEHTDKIFQTDDCIKELADYIKTFNKKVFLAGFSLGAQLAFKLVSEYEELFEAAIIVSPWLIKEEPFLSTAAKMNIKQHRQLKNKFFCNFIGMMNGLPSEQRKEFVVQMQNVKEETIKNIVYNGITIDSVPSFKDITIPITALAGRKEQKEIHESVRKMSELNKNCRYEIWDKAGHNIPPLFSKNFNELIRQKFK